MAYIPGLPGPRHHAFHHPAHPIGAPAVSRSDESLSQDESEDGTDLPMLRPVLGPESPPERSGGGSRAQINPYLRGPFMPNFRQVERQAQEMTEGNLTRYTRPGPKKEERRPAPSPMRPATEERMAAADEAIDPEAQKRHEEQQSSPPQSLEDPLMQQLLAEIPWPVSSSLAQRLSLIPRHLLERCAAAGVRAKLQSPGATAYRTDTRQMVFLNQDLDHDFPIFRTAAQAIDHALGGDGLASRRALAVLAALPGPGWQPEDFFSQELARYLMGQHGGPLQDYLSYLLTPPK